MAFFCTKTGVRIAGPGVSKAVDPANGFDEVSEGATTNPAPVEVAAPPPAEPTKPETKEPPAQAATPNPAPKGKKD